MKLNDILPLVHKRKYDKLLIKYKELLLAYEREIMSSINKNKQNYNLIKLNEMMSKDIKQMFTYDELMSILHEQHTYEQAKFFTDGFRK